MAFQYRPTELDSGGTEERREVQSTKIVFEFSDGSFEVVGLLCFVAFDVFEIDACTGKIIWQNVSLQVTARK